MRPHATLLSLVLTLICSSAAISQSLQSALGPLPPPPVPAGNPMTPARIMLGKTLFWDEQMSSTRTMACGTCHSPQAGGGDRRWTAGAYYPGFHPGADGIFWTADDVNGSLGVPHSTAAGDYQRDPSFGLGAQVTERQTPAVYGAAYAPSLYLDGRAEGAFHDPVSGAVVLPAGAALEIQALGPPLGTGEMAHQGRDWLDVAQRIEESRPLALALDVPPGVASWIDCRRYPALFEEAFGTRDVTPVRIVMAIASYERTLIPDQTPFDDALAGGVPLMANEQRGWTVFNDAGCAECHSGSRLTDDEFSYIGVRPAGEDPGRFAVTGDPDDLGAFRTPALRNIELRFPYMHGGQFFSLEEIVEFYDRGGDFTAPNLDSRMVPLGLTVEQKSDLVAFLKRPLSDPRVLARTDPFDHPMLYTRSGRVPGVTEAAISGSSGSTPRMIGLEPPLAGNPSFTLAVTGALGGARAELVIDSAPPGPIPLVAPSFYAGSTTLSGVGQGNGDGSLSLAIPDDPTLAGSTLYARWYVDDGGWAASQILELTIFRTSCCTAICGDCDESGSSPDILDSLAAARIAVALSVPTATEELCCDVDATATITILDSLAIAQRAAGLSIPLACR